MASLTRRLRDIGPVHGARARVAAYMSQEPARLAFLSLAQIASEAHVGKATVSRFVQNLGYANFAELRDELREELYPPSASPARRHAAGRSRHRNDGPPPKRADVARILDRHAARSSRNLRTSVSRAAAEEVASLCADLIAARRVWVFGQRFSYGIAFNLVLHLRQLLPDVALLGGEGGTAADSTSSVGPDDHVLIVVHARPGRDKVPLARFLTAQGVAYSLLTDLPHDAPIVRGARRVLRTRTDGSGAFHDYSSTLSLAQALVAVLETTAPTARSRLLQVESTLHAFDAFAPEPEGGSA